MNSFHFCRVAKGMTQKRAADALGITQGTISQWETGVSMPRSELLPKIASIYGCTIEQLLQPARMSIFAPTRE